MLTPAITQEAELKSQSDTLFQNTREIKIQNEISNKNLRKKHPRNKGSNANAGHNGA